MQEYTRANNIKSWAEDDRPREKLLMKGRAALSDAELVAILLGSGSKNETAVDLAKRILTSANNNLSELSRLNANDLQEFKGIGEAKAISIITALELGKRRRQSEALVRKKITSSAQVFEVMQPLIGDLPHEEFWTLYLSTSNRLISSHCITKGGLSSTTADVRIVLRQALQLNATGFIICHNHPSGDCKPSQVDGHLTRKMCEAGKVMDVKLLDHLIITEHQYYSFADEGNL